MSEAKIECVSPRTGIKSSLKEHVQAIVTSYILWVEYHKPFCIKYSEEYSEPSQNGTTTKIRFTDNASSAIKSYLSTIDLSSINKNVLCSAQIEALQTGMLNVYKLAHISFVGDRPGSAERTGGNRYEKCIYYSALVDVFHAFIQQNEQAFKQYALKVVSGQKFTDDSFHKSLGEFWSPFIDITRFKTLNENELELLGAAVSQKENFHENGTARILRAYLSDSLHPYITIDRQDGGEDKKVITKRNSDFDDYFKRSELLHSAFRPNYCSDDEISTNAEHNIPENTQAYTAEQDAAVPISVNHLESSYSKLPLPLNMILSGVPGTGKSFLIKEIIENYFASFRRLDNGSTFENVLKINVHSETKNSSLMQGISVGLNAEGSIFYGEKRGAILELILTALQYPDIPFLVVLEEIQENSLNLLIGDLIYLIESDKRVDLSGYESERHNDIWELIESIINDLNPDYIDLPALISKESKRKLIIPNNVYFICTANHRDDKKIIEDNLLRRFDFIEVFPRYEVIENPEVRIFVEKLNENIIDHFIHTESEHMVTGHATWMRVNDETQFWRSFSKFLTDMRKIKQVDFSDLKAILGDLDFPLSINFDFEQFENYHALFSFVQNKCDYQFMSS